MVNIGDAIRESLQQLRESLFSSRINDLVRESRFADVQALREGPTNQSVTSYETCGPPDAMLSGDIKKQRNSYLNDDSVGR